MRYTAYPILYGVYCIPDTRLAWVNSLAPGEFDYSLQLVNFKLISMINILSIFCAIVIRWMPQQLTDHQSTLVQAMAWCRQATSHYLSQCWPRPLSPYGVTRPQWVNRSGDTPSWLNYLPQFQLCIPRGLSHHCRQSEASSAKLGQLACDSQGQPQGQKMSNLIPGWARNPSYKRVHQFIMQTLWVENVLITLFLVIQTTILHTFWCLNMCKIVSLLDFYFSCKNKMYFYRIWLMNW